MDIQAYEDFLQIIDSIAGSEMSFRYEVETERGYQIVKSAINEVGLFLSIEQINIADRAFGNFKNKNEEILINYYKNYLVKIQM